MKTRKHYATINRRFYLLVGFFVWLGFMSLTILAGNAAWINIIR